MSYEKLTIEQQGRIAEYREKYFVQATSCEPADRHRAETAAHKIGELSGVKIDKIYWVNNPADVISLRTSRYSLIDPQRASIIESMIDSLRDSLRDSMIDSMIESLRASMIESLRASLSDSLIDSLSDSLSVPLRDSARDSLWSSGWLCFYSYCADVLGIEIDDATREKLRLHNEIAASCFAVWIMPGAAILCERPQSVKIVNGKLVDIEWRRK